MDVLRSGFDSRLGTSGAAVLLLRDLEVDTEVQLAPPSRTFAPLPSTALRTADPLDVRLCCLPLPSPPLTLPVVMLALLLPLVSMI